jgi:hypothetical protein
MRALGGIEPAYDHELAGELLASGFTHCFRSPDTGPLEAALVVEAAARGLAVASVGATCLIAPATLADPPDGPIALVLAGRGGPARFVADATTILVVGSDEVRRIEASGDGERVRSSYGYPMGRPDGAVGEPVAGVLPERVVAWWRLSLAVELVGTMRAALEHTITYVGERQQFGRPIGSFQAIQHRLAECAVLAEGSRWLALEAAWNGAPTEAAAAALTHAVTAARRVMQETHQLTGAMGFTTEYDLHLWTMRIPALVREAEAMAAPGRAVAESRWSLRSA